MSISLAARRLGIAAVLLSVTGLGVLCAGALGRTAQRLSGARACRTSGLSIQMVHSMAGLGHAGGTLAFTNTSSRTCELRGWPTLISVTASGATRAAQDVPGEDVGTTVTATPGVVLRPRRTAYVVFEAPDGSRTGQRCPPPAHVLKITPPQNTESVSISAWIPYLDAYLPSCGPIEVSPVTAAASLGSIPPTRSSARASVALTRSPPKVLIARPLTSPAGAVSLPRGTVLPASEIGTPREFRTAKDGFALGGPLESTYPVFTVNGGATWKIAGPVLCNATADGALAVESVAVLGRNLDVAYGSTVIDVTSDGGTTWYQVFPQDNVVAVVTGFHGIAAYVQVTNTNNAVTGTNQYVSTDDGRRWTLSNAVGG